MRFRQGEPARQIRWEVKEGSYDLIVVGAEPSGRWQRLFMSELVAPMLAWLDRPLLIARPAWSTQNTVGDKEHE